MKMIKLNKYKARLPWLNDTLKAAIKHKNVLYVKQLRTKGEDDIKFYKSYRLNCWDMQSANTNMIY